MAILEAGIVFKSTTLITKKFYNSKDVITPEIRKDLLDAVYNMATDIYQNTLQKFSFGKYLILIQSYPLKILSDDDKFDISISFFTEDL